MWWRRKNRDVAAFLYGLLVADAPRGYARTIADRMGVPYPTLSKYWLGKRRFPAALVRPLFLATDQDPRVAEFFVLDGSRYALTRRDDDPDDDLDLAHAVLTLSKLEGRVSALYLDAIAPTATTAPRSAAPRPTP